VFLIFSWTIHALEGFLRSDKGTPLPLPARTKHFVILDKFLIHDRAGSKTHAFLLLLPFCLAGWGRPKKEVEGEDLVTLVVEAGDGDARKVGASGRCLNLSSRC